MKNPVTKYWVSLLVGVLIVLVIDWVAENIFLSDFIDKDFVLPFVIILTGQSIVIALSEKDDDEEEY